MLHKRGRFLGVSVSQKGAPVPFRRLVKQEKGQTASFWGTIFGNEADESTEERRGTNTQLLINSRVLSKELIAPQLLEKFPALCGIRSFITLFIYTCHFSLSHQCGNQHSFMLHKRGRFLGVSSFLKRCPVPFRRLVKQEEGQSASFGGQYLEMRQMKQQKNVEEQTHSCLLTPKSFLRS